MAKWLNKHRKLQEFMGLLKDRVSLARAVTRTGRLSQIDIVVLHATGHDEKVVDDEIIKAVLEVGSDSRMHVASCVSMIMDRLNNTENWIVALKCLFLIHKCWDNGGFIFEDQLSIFPSQGGRNYLNLSKFKDRSSSFTWAASTWIRWYARYIEQWIQTSRTISTFVSIKTDDLSLKKEKLMSLTTLQLVKEAVYLKEFLHEAARWKGDEFVMNHALVKRTLYLIIVTTHKACQEIKLRFQELTERILLLMQKEALTLLNVCEELSEDTESLVLLFQNEVNPLDGAALGEELRGLKLGKLGEILGLTSLHKALLSLQHVCSSKNLYQMSKSDRWAKMTVSNFCTDDIRRGKSMSEFHFCEEFF
ncbi:hypothetical protein KP509_04G013800 [Ceratopteris richardii]|uniref:ENTH domain-containing protein n=1 Tax=Ceratopteris richardii TaxID=49495 RepID=A0A8T2V2D2_CERRI|nr:hypothetical protein KP509_04G013800 [Ceratopteris richardii]KAH7438408.1 hypothetical protein KP509_04G013800 [Ceratopteris richardii]KAH7438409.1 hypothetical protein KP509_04G013800 [Ceratopteris richardii]